ncbi:hypothetical protein SBA5_760011 [Candidatus Sulfotelmatomonas gaucii]|uniref:Uncharacterized protein n=1 Tax=Candidatus Sulfuritelmatomonas gaucii TaxID=2043161 RepID=A0A2N9M406_9BACT|nr:hypothetical protein SBA5_760011 [Candidatus Sulfotelmatomonas gaucii]
MIDTIRSYRSHPSKSSVIILLCKYGAKLYDCIQDSVPPQAKTGDRLAIDSQTPREICGIQKP